MEDTDPKEKNTAIGKEELSFSVFLFLPLDRISYAYHIFHHIHNFLNITTLIQYAFLTWEKSLIPFFLSTISFATMRRL
jgi:hypothetical protein